MTKKELVEQIKLKKSFLCIGLDSDIQKIPSHLLDFSDPILEFNKQIIDATHAFCVAYKPNIAFYESLGSKGWDTLQQTINYIPKNIFTIADAKRGDIGNTSDQYAKTFFETYSFDAVTVAPYMGSDSVTPYLNYNGKWTILLALTSNSGALDFETQELANGKMVFEQVLETSLNWGDDSNLMYVVGATRGENFKKVRAIVPQAFLLVPGVGAQGGSLQDVVNYGFNSEVGILVNSSRDIIYASSSINFASKSAEKAHDLQKLMELELIRKGII